MSSLSLIYSKESEEDENNEAKIVMINWFKEKPQILSTNAEKYAKEFILNGIMYISVIYFLHSKNEDFNILQNIGKMSNRDTEEVLKLFSYYSNASRNKTNSSKTINNKMKTTFIKSDNEE